MSQEMITDLPPALKKLQEKIFNFRKEKKIEIQHGDEGYATAPSNIALIKYWGKVLDREQIPVNSSLSYTIGGFRSFTKVIALGRFFPEAQSPLFKNKFVLQEQNKSTHIPQKMDRLIRSILFPFANEISIEVQSFNNFPTACGIASSASGYAALVGALADLLGLGHHFSQEELQFWLVHWARLGSGSACRSAVLTEHNAFVKWQVLSHEKESNCLKDFSFVQELRCHPKWKKLRHCVFILNSEKKIISSSRGHTFAQTSPFQTIRVSAIPARVEKMERALQQHDFELVQFLSEDDALLMHAVMQTSQKRVCYLNFDVAKAISLFVTLRNEHQLPAFWSLDAGPNIHVLYMPESSHLIKDFAYKLENLCAKKIPVLQNFFSGGLFIGKQSYQKIVQSENLIQDFI